VRAWFAKVTGRRRSVEKPPSVLDPNPYNPPLPVLTPEEQEVKTEEQRKLFDEHDKKVSRGGDDPPGGAVTP
jgi:hypothetical protein